MPHGPRSERIGDLIREELSSLLLRQVRDPGMRSVTVTRVQMTRDLQLARVYYTVHEDTRDKRDAERALRRAKPFLRRQLAGRLQLRHMPELTFFHDDALEREDRVARLLKEISAARDEEVNKDNVDDS